MGGSVTLVGEIGSGNTTKLANQIIVALNIAAMSEAMVLATKAGVDPEKVFEAIRGGLAGSTVLNAKAPWLCKEISNRLSHRIAHQRFTKCVRYRACTRGTGPHFQRDYGNHAGT
jgi:3-hydroxyisobutyrate dehydrogenase-like beta-hydroxyacid dehydrogenase